jgi:hypothetical protein
MPTPYISVREAAALVLKKDGTPVKPQWIYENIKRGKIKAVIIDKHILITRKELERFIVSR